jgi:AbrB family looped-hinge helix DNA binding protein
MEQVTVNAKRQITIPLRIAQSANIHPNDTLTMTYNNGMVTIVPQPMAQCKTSIMLYAGIAKGVWGSTTAEIDNELQQSRNSWER